METPSRNEAVPGTSRPISVIGGEHKPEDFCLSDQASQVLWRMEERHFWHRARNDWILGFLRKNGIEPGAAILEVGCGSGTVLRSLDAAGYRVTGVDTERRQIEKARLRCPRADLYLGAVENLPAAHDGRYSAIAFLDVLEHLDRPERLVRASFRLGRPGSLVLATVPALQSLYTIIDTLSGHKRRYERGELARLLEDLGLEEVEEHGIFRASLPLLRLHRRPDNQRTSVTPEDAERLMLWNLRIPSGPINGLMGWLCGLERRLGASFSRNKAGASLLAFGRLRAR